MHAAAAPMVQPEQALQQAPKGQEAAAEQEVPVPVTVPAGQTPLQSVVQTKVVELQQMRVTGQVVGVQEVPVPAAVPAGQVPP